MATGAITYAKDTSAASAVINAIERSGRKAIAIQADAADVEAVSGGRIIMIGSSVGERVLVPGLVAYSATKGAVKMFTQGLSREVASLGITGNNVQPGPIDTDLNPAVGEWALPQKAATALDRYGRVASAPGPSATPMNPKTQPGGVTICGGQLPRDVRF